MCHHKAPHRPWQPAAKAQEPVRRTATSPSPTTSSTTTKHRARAAADATMRVGEDMNKTDLKRDFPPDLKGDALRKWAYQLYIKDYLRCIPRVDDNVGRLLDYLDAEGLAAEHHRHLHLRPGLLPRRPRLVRQALHVRGVAAHAVPDALPRRHQARHRQSATWSSTSTSRRTFLDYAGVRSPRRHAGPQLPPPSSKATRPSDWRKSMYYRYWMHIHQRPPRARPLRRAQRYAGSSSTTTARRSASSGANPPDTTARVGALRRPQRPARNAQPLPRPQIRPRGNRNEISPRQVTKRSRRQARVGQTSWSVPWM